MFRAYDADRDRLVAVKLFRLDLPPDRMHQLVARLERLIAAPLTHPAIAAPIATGTDGIIMYLVQDFVAAESLDVVIRDHGPSAPAAALRVTTQLAEALDAAAAADVVHGALHPRDVLLSQDDTRLTGLGVAKAIEDIGVAPPVRRPYSAPERVAGEAWDRRADVFSLAALAYEMLTGKRVSGVGAEAAAALPEIHGADMDALRDAFTRGLAPSPGDRFETALDFASAMKTALPKVIVEREPLLPLDEAVPSVPAELPLRTDYSDTTERQRGLADQPSRVALRRSAEASAEAEARSAEADDIDLRAAEASRYDEVEIAPAIVSTDDVSDIRARLFAPDAEPEPITRAPAGFLQTDAAELTIERTQTSISLVALAVALIVGVAIGFAAGYAVAGRQPAPAPVAAAAPPATVPSGREFTESPVKEEARPTPAAPAAPKADAATEVRLKPDATKEVRLKPDTTAAAPAVTPKTAATNGPGRLLVRSTPAGARVIVDGQDRGVTPAAIRGLARGAHRVRVERDGYVADDRRVVITAARPAQSFTVAMARASTARAANSPRLSDAPASGVGALAVESRPPGASVFLDGRRVGKTPLTVPNVGPGEHTVRLERDGYRPWSSVAQITSGEPTRVTASLER